MENAPHFICMICNVHALTQTLSTELFTLANSFILLHSLTVLAVKPKNTAMLQQKQDCKYRLFSDFP